MDAIEKNLISVKSCMNEKIPETKKLLTLYTFPAVEVRISASWQDMIGTASVRANWGRMEINMVIPADLNGITYTRDIRGAVAAMAAQKSLDMRFAYDGELTDRGLKQAQDLIVQAISEHSEAVAKAKALAQQCIEYDQEVARLEKEEKQQVLPSVRPLIRRQLKDGELAKKRYDQLIKLLKENDEKHLFRIEDEKCTLDERFEQKIGLPITFEHALAHLASPSCVKQLNAKTLKSLADIRDRRLSNSPSDKS